MIGILIAEDQTMMRSALTRLLELEDDLTVVGGVGRADEAVAAAGALRPDVLVLDIELPGGSGLDAIAPVLDVSPGTTVVIVTTFGRAGYLRRAMDAGARAFVIKDEPVARLAEVIRRAHAGETIIDPALAAESLTVGRSPLSDREREVLEASADGDPIARVARRLHLSPSTVRNHLSSAIGKTGARNRAEALHIARRNGWL